MTAKRRCSQCGKPNAKPPARLCYTCKTANAKLSSAKRHDAMIVQTYGMQPGEYAKLMALQGGKCAICSGGSTAKRRLALDHDHVTGKPRGLLCRSCNYVLLGRIAKDDVSVLERILEAARGYYADPPYQQMLREKPHD